MRHTKSFAVVLGVAALCCAALAPHADAGTIHRAQTIQEARDVAGNSDLPILIKVGAEWCTSCKAFDEATMSDDHVRAAIGEHAILLATDGEKGEGVDIARAYGVTSYPTFVLTNADGDLLDRWSGYWKADHFVKSMAKAVENPVSVADRLERFHDTPNEADALKLGQLRHSEGMYAEAAAYYRRAQALAPDSDENYSHYVLKAVTHGAYNNVFTLDDVRREADAILASSDRDDLDALNVAYSMRQVSAKLGDRDAVVPYLKVAIEETDANAEGKVAKMRAKLMPDYAMRVQNQPEKAVEYLKASMGESWMDDANQLNNFAWWCFENEVNLDEAEALARKGVELAKAGTEKANILDTVAEICNVKGDCADSVDLIHLAIAEDPNNPYFQKQLERFETLLAAMND